LHASLAGDDVDRTSAGIARLLATGQAMKVRGYPVVFGVPSVDLGGFIEVISPLAVDRTLDSTDDVIALANHNSDHPLGRRGAGTLRLIKDRVGLAIQLDVDEQITFAGDVVRMLQRGDGVGGSFGFTILDDAWSRVDGMPFREVVDMTIREVSVGVVFPAYPSTNLHLGQRSEQPRGRSIAFAERQQKQALTK
jgi:HK97 family phage prohead protease